MRVGGEIEQFFRWFPWRHEKLLCRRQFTFGVELFHQTQDRVRSFLVGVGLRIGPLRMEVADIAVSLGADGSYPIYRFIAAVARPEDIFPLPGIRSKKYLTLHVRRQLHSSQVK